MRAVVVYESLWGNTAAVAGAIAEGLGPEARALSTAEATGSALGGVDLIVAGAPVLGFKLPTDRCGERADQPGKAPSPPDLSHPSMRSWLDALPARPRPRGCVRHPGARPFGKAAPAIAEGLEKAGYRAIAEPTGFVVAGKFGPLRDGELERARRWGAELADAMR